MEHSKTDLPGVSENGPAQAELVDPREERRRRRAHLRLVHSGPAKVAPLSPPEHDVPVASIRVDPASVPRASLRRHALLPLAMLVCAGAYYGAGLSIGAVVGIAAILLMVQTWIGPWVRTSRDRLDRDLLLMVVKGRHRELPRRFEDAWGFRLFGPPGEVAERQGRALREAGDPVAAQVAYAAALEGYGGVAPLPVVSGYAYSAYEAGDDAVAIDALSAALKAAPDLADLRTRLGHAMVRGGAPQNDAEALFAAGAPERALLAALALARRGQPKRATKLARGVDRTAPRLRALVAELELSVGPLDEAPLRKTRKTKSA